MPWLLAHTVVLFSALACTIQRLLSSCRSYVVGVPSVVISPPTSLPRQEQVDRLRRELSEAGETAERSEEALRAELQRREEEAGAQVRGGKRVWLSLMPRLGEE